MQPRKHKVTSIEVTSGKVGMESEGWIRSKFVDGQDLASLVVTAARASDVRGGGATALGAHVELAGTPPLTTAAEALLHLGRFTFRDCHDGLKLG